MQRYHAGSCTSAVNNSAIGGASARDSARADSSSLSPNFSVNSRRQSQQVTSYKLKCEKESLNSRLGPPDFLPQTQTCPEETLTRENVQVGYKETIEGIEDNKEISLSQVHAFTKPVVLKCKDAIRKLHRAINESRAHKRKAGQVYGAPLSGPLLSKPGVFPEQKPCGEDFRKKWIEGLSQQHKRLRSLADHVPHGYRRKSLFEVLVRNNVPLLRATWFIKVTYLNQVRPGSGAADKTQLSRSELWTKDVIDYLQHLLDEFSTKKHTHSNPHGRDRPPQMHYSGSLQHKSDSTSAVFDAEEPSLHFKWWYVVRLLHWHQAEGLLLPSLIIDWVLTQLQEKTLLEILQLLLPIVHGLLETITLSQTYVRTLVTVAIRFIREPSPGGSDLVDNSRRAYTVSALAEMLRYLIQAVPETFVAIDCFPLPPCVVSHTTNDGNFLSKSSEDNGKVKDNSAELAFVLKGNGIDSKYQSLSLVHLVSGIQKRADNLAKGASYGCPSQGMAKAVQALDKSLLHGDIREAYRCIFEDLSDGDVDEGWVSEVSPCLRSSLKWIGSASLSFICSVFFLCEWATCDFRDFRVGQPSEMNFTGRKDLSQVYVAIQFLKLKMTELQNPTSQKNERSPGVKILSKTNGQQNTFSGLTFEGNGYQAKSNTKIMDGRFSSSDLFASPGPLHDIVVCWIDQHEGQKEESSKRFQLFVLELIQSGIFSPQAYVRQLIVSGIMDLSGSPAELDRRRRHYRVLKLLPGLFMQNALEEARTVDGPELAEAVQVYSNERRLVLHQLSSDQHNPNDVRASARKQKHHSTTRKDGASQTAGDKSKPIRSTSNAFSSTKVKRVVDLEELKISISTLLQLPSSASTSIETGVDESQGSVKRPIGLIYNKIDPLESTSACGDCKRAKRQKLSEDKSSSIKVPSPIPSDDEDTWWVRKGSKLSESSKVEPPIKTTKQVSRGRQKNVRKTQSLAQLAAARIDGSQGASTSHVCDNKTHCPHFKTEADTLKSLDGIQTAFAGDMASLGRAIKQLRFVEKKSLSVWLMSAVRQLVEETEKSLAKVGQYGRPFIDADEKNTTRWKLGEDELSVILYILDISNDLASAVKFLLWLVPKVLNNPSPTIHSGRNILMLPKNVENQACHVGESFLLSAIRRYENIVIARDLIPEVLSALMNRAAGVVASTGRISSSAAIGYARYLLKRYGNSDSVISWEKNVKGKYDRRLVSEVEAGRSLDGEFGLPIGVAGIEDLDDYFRQKIDGGRFYRVGLSMREVVLRHVDEAFQYFNGKERKLAAASPAKAPTPEKWDDVYQIAQQIVIGLMDCIRQTGGAAQEGDPSLVASAVSAIVSNVGQCIAKIPDITSGSNYSNYQSSAALLNIARRTLRIHITSLCLLKDALGERQSRVFEIALAKECCSTLTTEFGPGKSSRNQFQQPSEVNDSNPNMSSETSLGSAKVSKATKIAAAVSALVIGAVIHGVTNLERMVTVFRLKEGLDVMQFVRSAKTNSNGNARSVGSCVEVYVHWFRVLVGNCRTVCDGLVVDLVGEQSIVALLRTQRNLPINLVLPPAYAIFAFSLWKPFILSSNIAGREDIHQLYQSLTMAIGDAVKHLPFRDVCLRDTNSLYNLVAADSTDADFAALLELNGLDSHLKSLAFVPLRARLFLNALIECRMPNSEDRASEVKATNAESITKLKDKLVHVLDTLHPAKFHWQWVELRLLLNEQALLEKIENHDASLVDAIRSSSPSSEKSGASENESNFIEIILTRLLVRPDAASLFSEVVHLFGRSLDDSMLMQAKWFLAGQDVLFGRKTVRQRLINIAVSKGLSTKPHSWRPWGWSFSNMYPSTHRGEKKIESFSLEEGEVSQEAMGSTKNAKGTPLVDAESVLQQQTTEKAFIELVLPCIDQSSEDSRSTFANELIKQLNNIEQQVSSIMRGLNKQTGTASSGIEGSTTKVTTRKGIRGGSPGLARRQAAAAASADSSPPSPAALRASLSLRMQFVVRLLPIICADGEPSQRNMKYMLASVILRLLGSRVVYEEVDLYFNPAPSKKERDVTTESSVAYAVMPEESLFDRLLLVLHGLLSSCQPSWLRSKNATKSSKEFSGFDREMAENLQSDLDRTQLPEKIRWRIQAAMPTLSPSLRYSISCHPSPVPAAALSLLQPSVSAGSFSGTLSSPQRPLPSARMTNAAKSKSSPTPTSSTLPQDSDIEIDPWTLLEDGAGSGPSASHAAVLPSSDPANLRASSWLKGTVRIRRTDLSYLGAIDDDS